MRIQNNAELAGLVNLKISGGERGDIETGWFSNLILDQGLRALITEFSSLTDFVAVGSSSTSVVTTDTGLGSPLARRIKNGNTLYGWDELGGYGFSRITCIFPRGTAAGNISELSLGWANNNSSAFARALVKNQSGDPTTITVLSDEVLTVTWEVRRWWVISANETISYDNDGIPASTLISYRPASLYDKSRSGLGSGGAGGAGLSPIGDGFTGVGFVAFAESQGNPLISSVRTLNAIGSSNIIPYELGFASFTPPIPKTSEFKVEIEQRLTVARRT